MNIRNTITRFITVAVVVAAIAVTGSIWMAEQAGATGRSDINDIYIFQSPPIGFIPGQTLRFSVFNPNAPEQQTGSVSGHVKIFDSTGRLIAQSEEIAIAPGQFHSFDFNRDDLFLSGESGTGRLQARGIVQVSFMDGSVRNLSARFPISIEVIDNASGNTYTGYTTISDGILM